MNQSYWQKDKIKSFPKLEEDIDCDVLIIGGGLAGLCTAHHFNGTNLKVVVIDKDTLMSHTSSHTTAKVTVLHGLVYQDIARLYGNYYAYLYYKSNEEAYKRMLDYINQYHIQCDFEDNDSYIYSDDIKIQVLFDRQKQLFQSFKIPMVYLDNHICSLGLKNQGIFNPMLYAASLIEHSPTITFYEHTQATHIRRYKNEYKVSASNHTITCRYLVHATRYPMIYKGLFFTKMYQEKHWVSYCHKQDHNHSLLNMSKTYSYRKVSEGCLEVKDEGDWYTMDSMTYRHIPYIGRYKHNEFVIYGFSKWGMTLSEVAGQLISDLILEKKNAYEELYSPNDENYSFLYENKDLILDSLNQGYIKGRFEYTHIDHISCNEGGIIKKDNKLVAVYKDQNGTCHYFSPYCRHMLCLLQFDKQSHTWVCPCHQSVYDCYGKIIEGPSIKCLKEQKE